MSRNVTKIDVKKAPSRPHKRQPTSRGGMMPICKSETSRRMRIALILRLVGLRVEFERETHDKV